ncbi:hypothetical protein [Paraburkholderia ribeironis]|uniref:hypothetical protein n=1 Tax=Paraburkholderia ribeironis TaxID=1247936 RepID=UPI000B9D534E|nr:hypothetical protein [Paraburkholderia ribeironis]
MIEQRRQRRRADDVAHKRHVRVAVQACGAPAQKVLSDPPTARSIVSSRATCAHCAGNIDAQFSVSKRYR